VYAFVPPSTPALLLCGRRRPVLCALLLRCNWLGRLDAPWGGGSASSRSQTPGWGLWGNTRRSVGIEQCNCAKVAPTILAALTPCFPLVWRRSRGQFPSRITPSTSGFRLHAPSEMTSCTLPSAAMPGCVAMPMKVCFDKVDAQKSSCVLRWSRCGWPLAAGGWPVQGWPVQDWPVQGVQGPQPP
jgi:hypothetical protein